MMQLATELDSALGRDEATRSQSDNHSAVIEPSETTAFTRLLSGGSVN
jgi:hypothetical protein